MSSNTEVLLSFFGEESWPYVLNDHPITSAMFFPTPIGKSSRVIVHLKSGKALSILKLYSLNNEYVWEIAEFNGNRPTNLVHCHSVSQLFYYLSL